MEKTYFETSKEKVKHFGSVLEMLTEDERKAQIPLETEEQKVAKIFGWDK